jgi:hypothetical protein
MQVFQIAKQPDAISVSPLPVPSLYRKGDVPAEYYRNQASGASPRADLNLKPARFVRTIRLKDGDFSRLAGGAGALLTVVITGALTLRNGAGPATTFVPGDLFLSQAEELAGITVTAQEDCGLLQIGVAADGPGAEATLQTPGTPSPRTGAPNIKRVRKGDDDLAYFGDFPEVFPAPENTWSEPRSIRGFRFMCWEDGFIDWHPEVINCFGMFLSGQMEIESSGDRKVEIFRTGDICLAEDRTGVGHIDRCHGATHVLLLVSEDEAIW